MKNVKIYRSKGGSFEIFNFLPSEMKNMDPMKSFESSKMGGFSMGMMNPSNPMLMGMNSMNMMNAPNPMSMGMNSMNMMNSLSPKMNNDMGYQGMINSNFRMNALNNISYSLQKK